MIKVKFVFKIFIFGVFPVICLAKDLSFNVTHKIKTVITNENNKMIEYRFIGNEQMLKKESFNVDVENATYIIHEDYNFDGKEDFALWHTDDGMGIYDIFRIFIFTEKDMIFKEIKPKCGDDFINLKIDKKRRELNSIYYSNNEIEKCITKTLMPY